GPDHSKIRSGPSILGEFLQPNRFCDDTTKCSAGDAWTSHLYNEIITHPPLFTDEGRVHFYTRDGEILSERTVRICVTLDRFPPIKILALIGIDCLAIAAVMIGASDEITEQPTHTLGNTGCRYVDAMIYRPLEDAGDSC